MHILVFCIFKKYYVQMIVKYAKQNERVKDIDTPMEVVKNIRPQGLETRWLRNLSSLGYSKAEEVQIWIIWCLPHILDHLNIGIDSIMGASWMLLTKIARLFYSHSET